MKIESTFDPETSHVEIKYDTEMQKLLLAASRAIAKHFDAETYAQFSRDLEDQNREYDLDNGSRLLLDLIRSKTFIVETDSERMRSALTFLCLITIHMVKAGRTTAPLVPVLTVLANISPFQVLSIPLPPANEVLDRHKTPPEIWKTYQRLQTSRKSETAFLSVAQGHELFFELKKTLPPGSSLKDFLVFLDASCLFYRLALEALAAANKASEGKAKK